ncbi:MAG: N-acetylmuramic acid 6-phosphate etherase [Clostridia bacterium]|nr:N-acetylmuramic acid 6-phosphate etherase [Clostridia bacterium]
MFETEMRNPKTTHIDKASTAEIIKLINEENYRSVDAVETALPEIEAAVDIVTEAIANGGRLVYMGAGTSGRLATADAAECPPTYGVDYNTVIAVIAGGESTLVRAAENQEDSGEAGVADLKAKNLTSLDVVMGVSASGSAEYVARGMEYARSIGCKTIALCSNPETKIKPYADVYIYTPTGAEVVTGSTRMKAGNAQKMVMNMISTAAMVKTGKVYENMMINLKPTNIKLRGRMIGIVCEMTGISREDAEQLLINNDFSIPKAVDSYKSKP